MKYQAMKTTLFLAVAMFVCAFSSTASAQVCDQEYFDDCDVEQFKSYGGTLTNHGTTLTTPTGFTFDNYSGNDLFTSDGDILGTWLHEGFESQVMTLPDPREYVTFLVAGEAPKRLHFVAVDTSGNVVDVQTHTNDTLGGAPGQAQTVLVYGSGALIEEIYIHIVESLSCDLDQGRYRFGEVRACDIRP